MRELKEHEPLCFELSLIRDLLVVRMLAVLPGLDEAGGKLENGLGRAREGVALQRISKRRR